MADSDKLDHALRKAYRAHQALPADGPAAGISVTLRFTGDIDDIVDLGFELHAVVGDMAIGVISFDDLPNIAANSGVLHISAGSRPKQDLDTAVADVRARAPAPVSGAPTNGLWHVANSGGALTSTADGTGKDVIVAVIDTGIDFTHPAFMSQLTPQKRTRILRIWDQGLVPASLNDAPDPARLVSADTYGVEFEESEINDAINNVAPIAHRDCDGHGTHVTCIAAGGPQFPTGHGGDTTHMGPAPDASIIAVKFLDTADKLYYRTNAGQGAEVGEDVRLYDAVVYCLRTARILNKPIVINMSFGDISKPGDGLDNDGRFLDALMDPAQPEDELHFPKEAILVKSAGNSGGDTFKITVPASGEIEVPIRLADGRSTIQTTWKECGHRLHDPELSVNFWYRRTPAPLAVSFAMKLPHSGQYGAEVFAGGELTLGYRIRTGPPRAMQIEATTGTTVHRASLEHEDPGAVAHPNGGNVHRHHCRFFVSPKVRGGTVAYIDAVYWIRIKAPPGTVVHGIGDIEFFSTSDTNFGLMFLRLATTSDPGVSALSPGIQRLPDMSAMDPYGQHVITVAAYDDVGSVMSATVPHGIADFSSRGPLRDFSNPAGSIPVITKPDIAGPGVKLESAESAHTEHLLGVSTPAVQAGVRFVEHSGTSMSAPIVAGVVATMLDKNRTLNATGVRALLNTHARHGVDPAHGTAEHAEAYGSGMIDAATSHSNTP